MKSREIILIPFGCPCLIWSDCLYISLVFISWRFKKLAVTCRIDWQVVSIHVVNVDLDFNSCLFMICNGDIHFCLIPIILESLFWLNIDISNNIKSCSSWYGNILIFWSMVDLIFTNKFKTVISCIPFKNSNCSFRKRNT